MRTHNIDVVTVRDLQLLGGADEMHLANAHRLGRILCTHDSDFLEIALDGFEHSGIVFGQQDRHYIGDWVNWLVLMHAVYSPEDMMNQIEYL